MQQTYDCPHCHGLMKSFVKGDLEYEACNHCGGLWFDFGELKSALSWDKSKNFNSKEIKRGDDLSDHAHDYECITCDSKLEEREYAYDSAIHIDGCPNCKGLFVSAEDLQHIHQFLHSSKHSDEAREAHVKAHLALGTLQAEYAVKQAKLADEIDKLYVFDDLPLIKSIKPLNKISEWLIGELVDVDSFHIANRK